MPLNRAAEDRAGREPARAEQAPGSSVAAPVDGLVAGGDGGPAQRAATLADREAAAKRPLPAPRPAGDAANGSPGGHSAAASGLDEGRAGNHTDPAPASHAWSESEALARRLGFATSEAPAAVGEHTDVPAPHAAADEEPAARAGHAGPAADSPTAGGTDTDGPDAGQPAAGAGVDAVRMGAHAAPYMDADGTLHNLRPIARLAVSGPDDEPRRVADSEFVGQWFAAKTGSDDQPSDPDSTNATRTIPDQTTPDRTHANATIADETTMGRPDADPMNTAPTSESPADVPQADAGLSVSTRTAPANMGGGERSGASAAATGSGITPDRVDPTSGATPADQRPTGPHPDEDAAGHLVIDLDVTDLFGAMARSEQQTASSTGTSTPDAPRAWPPAPADDRDANRPPAAPISGHGGPGRVPTTGTDPEADAVRAEVAQRMAALSRISAADAAAQTTQSPEQPTQSPTQLTHSHAQSPTQLTHSHAQSPKQPEQSREHSPGQATQTPEQAKHVLPAIGAEPLRGRPEALSAADLEAIRWRLDGGTLREVVDNKDALRELGERLDGPLADEADNVVKAGLLSVRAEVYRLLGELGMAAAASRLALAHAESARDVQSTVIAQAELAHVLRLRGDFVEADRLFARAAAAPVPEPLRSVVHENAGRSCFDQGRHMEALDHFARAVRLGPPDDTDLAARIGVCLQAVYIHVLRDGWGPYPRTAPAEPEARSEPDAFDETTAERPIVHPR